VRRVVALNVGFGEPRVRPERDRGTPGRVQPVVVLDETPSLNARSGSHETSLTRLRDHAAAASVYTAREVSMSGWPYCRSKYATATIPFGTTDSHGKNWSSSLVVIC
jgi:hypothetical protein